MISKLTSLRDVPGFVKHAGGDWRYIESKNIGTFDNWFRQLMAFDFRNVPKDGGMVHERVEIKLPSGARFFGISYRGDLDGWRSKIEDYATAHAARIGRIEGTVLILSDGTSSELAACEIVQH